MRSYKVITAIIGLTISCGGLETPEEKYASPALPCPAAEQKCGYYPFFFSFLPWRYSCVCAVGDMRAPGQLFTTPDPVARPLLEALKVGLLDPSADPKAVATFRAWTFDAKVAWCQQHYPIPAASVQNALYGAGLL